MRKHASRPDTDNPEWTAREMRKARPVMDILPQAKATTAQESPTRSTADPAHQTARFKAAIAATFIEREEELSQYAGNPIPLWQAYCVARDSGQPIPDSVLTYFDTVARVLTAPHAPTSPAAFLKALGVATKGGPSKTKQAKTAARDLDLVSRIEALKRLANAYPDQNPDLSDTLGIMLRAASEFGLSVDRVQAVYRQVTEFDHHPGSTAATTNPSSQEPTKRVRRRKPVTRAARRQTGSRRHRRTNSRSS